MMHSCEEQMMQYFVQNSHHLIAFKIYFVSPLRSCSPSCFPWTMDQWLVNLSDELISYIHLHCRKALHLFTVWSINIVLIILTFKSASLNYRQYFSCKSPWRSLVSVVGVGSVSGRLLELTGSVLTSALISCESQCWSALFDSLWPHCLESSGPWG